LSMRGSVSFESDFRKYLWYWIVVFSTTNGCWTKIEYIFV
jgi:hypothetical protein